MVLFSNVSMFCCRIFAHSSIGTLFVTKFSHFSQMVPFLFYFFRTLLKYVVPFSKPLSASVPFGVKNSKGGYKKSAIVGLINASTRLHQNSVNSEINPLLQCFKLNKNCCKDL